VFTPSITIGVTLAPLIGGFLANPVPRLLPPSYSLLERHPYLLPALVTGSVTVVAGVTAIFLLPETLPSSLRKAAPSNRRAETPHGGWMTLLRYQRFQDILVLYSLHNAILFAWEALFPLYGFTRKSLGGLELSTQTLGIVLAISALFSILLTVFLFPVMHRMLPSSVFLRLCLIAYPVAVIFFPLIWALNYPAEQMGLGAWTALIVQMLLRRFGDLAATILDAMMMDTIPGPEYLAMANSITFSMAAVGRAVGPFIVSFFFSLSTAFASPLSLGRQLVWIVFILISLPPIYLAGRVREDANGTKETEDETHELLAGEDTSFDLSPNGNGGLEAA